MKITIARAFLTVSPLVLGTGCGSITHVPPGQSVLAAQARPGELVRLPEPPPSAAPDTRIASLTPVQIAAVEPDLPESSPAEQTADYETLAAFALAQGRKDEAIQAFNKVVEIDPSSSEGWRNLAYLYETTGDNQKALTAFKRYKSLATE